MTRRGGRLWALLGWLTVFVLAGCSPSAPSSGPSAAVPSYATPTPSADLVAARRAAGIADCPEPGDASVPGGLPDLTLDCLGGDTKVRLAALRGPMLINLWAQWCEPCRAEAADLSAFASTQDEVAVLGINYSDPQPELAIEFAELMSMKYPQLVDVEATVRGPLGVAGIPHTVLIDADGVIVARHPGAFHSLDEIKSWVEQGLAA
ncbi:MAG TPA: TlpA disulfide reductase family protein [Propionicimonas sp.]|nr:TlpA disulfide reductase family protein [Propionicimonas sp.]